MLPRPGWDSSRRWPMPVPPLDPEESLLVSFCALCILIIGVGMMLRGCS